MDTETTMQDLIERINVLEGKSKEGKCKWCKGSGELDNLSGDSWMKCHFCMGTGEQY